MPVRKLLVVVALAAAACSSGDSTPKEVAGSGLDVHHLPVGDGHYTTDTPKKGYVFLCRAGGPANAGGARTKGAWFSADGKTYDVTKKTAVRGSVDWPGNITVSRSGATRTIVTNDLPTDHPTGAFPVAADDPAHSVDPNPNTIKAQSLTYTLPASPSADASPHCMGGRVGVMTTGVELFNAFDALLRDAGAWEIQDGCQGHPEITGAYHYHSLSSCIADTSVRTVIGFALDGFAITGPKQGAHSILTTSDLDECHGLTSSIVLDGQTVRTYHYVMTQDFPYSVSCFRAAPIQGA